MNLTSILGDFVKTYCNHNIGSRFFLGFSCGVPFLLTLTILDLWLKDCGVSNTAIGLFSLLHWPFTLKFLWAPFIDRLNFPILSKKFGRRKGWALASHILLFLGLTGMSCCNLETSLFQLILCACIVAFADGCQDMSLYAYQLDKAKEKMLGPIAGVFIFGYRIGMFFSKCISLYLAYYFGWNAAYSIMAFSIFLCTFLIFHIDEPHVVKTKNEKQISDMVKSYEQGIKSKIQFIRVLKTTIFECLVCPFRFFMKRDEWKKLIAVVVLFRAGDIMAHKMAKPFYVDLGFSMLEIANVVQVFGTIATLIGGIVGGYLIKNFGIRITMFYSAMAHAFSCFAYVALSVAGHNIHMLYFTIFIENVTGGTMGTSFIAFLYSLCDKKYCATQYALLWAFYDCGGAVYRMTSGAIADAIGWTNYFLFIPVMFIPSMLILRSIMSHKTT